MTNEELAVLAREGDERSMEQLYLNVKRFMYQQAHKFSKTSYLYDVDDIFGICCEAFLMAVNDFDESKGFKFNTVLGKYIFNHYTSRYYAKEKRRRKYESLTSLDEPVRLESQDENVTFASLLKSKEHDFSDLYSHDYIESVRTVINNLSPLHRSVIELYLGRGISQKELASELGIHKTTVSAIVVKFRKKVLNQLKKDELVLA